MKLNKGIYFLLVGSALTVSSISCSDYLDTEPITDRAVELSDTPIKTTQQAEDYANNLYGGFGGEYWQLDYFFNGDAQTDIAYAGADNVQNFQQDEYRILATNNNVNRDWQYIYGYINDCNKILNYVDKVPDTGLSTARRAEMKSEAAIMRAMYYFHAVQLWGDVPLVTKAVIGVNSNNFQEVYSQVYPKRATTAEIYTQIISDLEGAIANAPASSNKFRANKGAAYALLARVYATKPSPDYSKAVQYCDLVAAQGYSLVSTYDHLFDGAHEGNSESIFEADGNGNSNWAWGTFMFYGDDWKKFNTPSNDLIKTFNDEGDTVRKNSSIWYSPNTVGWSDAFWPNNNFPFMYKMRQTDGLQNFYIARYADILLLKAEAKVQLGDLTGAATLVNQVRARVGLSPITIASKDDGLNKILKERKLELAFEGQRWFDLKRTGKAVEILSAQKNGNGTVLSYASNINANRLLWPIPQAQIDNNSNLTQNAGY